MNTAVAQYQKLDVQTGVEGANPHKLIDMLLEGARAQLRRAQGCIARQDIEGRTVTIGKAVSIIAGLQASLDHERGGELSANLDALYDYMQRRLFRANADNDPRALAEVLDLLRTLHEAWSAIGDQIPQKQHA